MHPGLTALVTTEGNEFKAALSNGRALFSGEIRELGKMLFKAGVEVDNAHCADWRNREDSPTAGQAIALKMEMRRLAGNV